MAVLGLAIVLFPVVSVGWAQKVPPSDTLLPNTTRGYFSVPNMSGLSDRWNKTQLGQLIKDPAMKAFVEDLRRQFDERWSGAREKLGFTLDDLRGLSGGEVSGALIQPGPEQVASVLLVDVTGHRKETDALLEKISANLKKQEATLSQDEVSGVKVKVFALAKPHGKGSDEPQLYAIFFLKGDLFGVCDHLDVAKGILARAGGKSGGSLAEAPAYQAVMKRLKADAGKEVSQVRWFIQPMGYLEVLRTARPEPQRRRGRTMLDVLRAQGFTGLRGAGGTLDFAVDGYEMVHRTAVFAPPPREKSMKMLKFPNATEFAPQRWVPGAVANYCTFYVDVSNAFEKLGPMVDELINEGKPGLWQDMVDGFRDNPNGVKIDLRKELVAHLGNRVTIVADYELPITTTSERLLFAIEVKNEKAVAAALTKLFKNDREMRRQELKEFDGRVIWESVPEDEAKVPEVRLELPGLGPDADKPPRTLPSRQGALMPNQAITVAHGHLLIASHLSFLKKVLGKIPDRDTLTRSVDYRLISKGLAKSGGAQRMAENFAKTDEQYRPTYELIRQGKMPESETLLGRLLNTFLGVGKKGVPRKQEIEGSKMPEFDFVRRYLGPAGLYAVSEENGWFIKGFLLPKQ